MVAVSIVVPTFNRAVLLDRLLDALDAQVPVPGGYEVIVVDDGSTDTTESVVERHDATRYLRQDNAGPAAARNRGWRAAAAEIVAFTDDDTVPSPTWLVDLAAAMEELDGVGGRIEPLVGGFLADFVDLERHVAHGVDDEGRVRYLVTANCAWRRSVLEAVDGFDESFRGASGEDTDLTLRAASRGFRLDITTGASVAHDHRASLLGVLRTYRKHGRSRAAVVQRNPDAGWGARRRAILGLRYWVARYRYYRTEAGRARALAYVCLRLLGMVAYSVGVLESRRSGAGSP